MKSEENEKNIQQIWELFKETDRRMKESDRRIKESMKETARQMKETDKKLAEALKAVGNLGGKWGQFVEGLVVPAVTRMFRERGIEVNRVYPRAKAIQNGQQMEIDVLAHDSDSAILIEVKSTLTVDDIKYHLRQLKKFKTFFPEHSTRKVYGAVAGITIEEGADRFAYQKGLFVIAQSGETVKILNDKKFKPKTW